MASLARMRVVLMAAVSVTLGGCGSALMEELTAAGDHLDRAASAPIEALRDVAAMAGEALKPPDLSPEAQRAYGDRLAAEALHRLPMADDPELQSHLTGMANRLAEHAPGTRFTYRVYLVEAKEPNAFTPGAGHIFVTTGLVARLGGEAQMAMVLGHEVAHSAAGHVVSTAHRRSIAQHTTTAGQNTFTARLGIDWIGDGLGMALNAAVNLYTRDQEDAADELGLEYMASAGYDVREAEKALIALLGEDGEEASIGETLFGDHSSRARRMQRLRNLFVAKYRTQDFSFSTRTTLAYERVSARYRAQP
jgi:predicted Zn-dependent protease